MSLSQSVARFQVNQALAHDESVASVHKRTFMLSEEDSRRIARARWSKTGVRSTREGGLQFVSPKSGIIDLLKKQGTKPQEQPVTASKFWEDASNVVSRIQARASIDMKMKRNSMSDSTASKIKETLSRLQQSIRDAKALFDEQAEASNKRADDGETENWPGTYNGRIGPDMVSSTSSGSETSLSGKEHFKANSPRGLGVSEDSVSSTCEEDAPRTDYHPSQTLAARKSAHKSPRAKPKPALATFTSAPARCGTGAPEKGRTAAAENPPANQVQEEVSSGESSVSRESVQVPSSTDSETETNEVKDNTEDLDMAAKQSSDTAEDAMADHEGEDHFSEGSYTEYFEECFECGFEMTAKHASVCATANCDNLVCPHCIDENLPHCDYCINEHLY